MLYHFQPFGVANYFFKGYGENLSCAFHMHPCFEFIMVRQGSMKVTVNGKEYFLRAGDSLMIFPNQLHSLESGKSRHMLCMFAPDLVCAYLSKIGQVLPESNFFRPEGYLIEALDKTPIDAEAIAKKGVLYSLCAAFDQGATYIPQNVGPQDLLSKIFAFVENNYHTNCTLEQLSTQIGYDYAYLSRCFKKSTGISYIRYLNNYRLNKACCLLDNTDVSILQCALDSGYSSLRTFNRNFKKQYTVSPTQYRKQRIR